MANLIGTETWSPLGQTTQVYKATHDGTGKRLSHIERSFISFTYGGKAIEDFGLIVTSDGEMERSVYANFSDLTETYDVWDGQVYWGSHFETNSLELTLSTDEMTENQLDNFREWFKPGQGKELILSEHPNRAIIARVSESPKLSMIPFEKKVDLKINNHAYETSTTVYRGNITLTFVMDEPYWYAKLNYMPTYVDKVTLESLTLDESNPNKVAALDDKDMRKIILEDGIPYQSLLSREMFLGGNLIVTLSMRVGTEAYIGQSYLGTITSTTPGFAINSVNSAYLFYSGTAPCKPRIQFSMLPVFNDQNYIVRPLNNMLNANAGYSNITIGDRVFKFTTPSILTGYNHALKIFEAQNGKDILSTINIIKESIKEFYSRAWAIACLNTYSLTAIITNDIINDLRGKMRQFIDETTPMTFIIDSETGSATGTFNVKVLDSTNIANASFKPIKENVGDMIRSDYLIIEGRNYLNSDGTISYENCKKITSSEELTNMLVFYKNMYL